MVSVNPNPPKGFNLDPTGMALPGLGSFSTPTIPATASTTLAYDDPTKKVRKPYTISKSRESWTEPEHDKFLEALQLFDRDWRKIEAFIGSKTIIQIRSHAQKYFLKVQKNGTGEHLPPPRPKRKAAHPYPQKAFKNDPVLSQVTGSFQTSPVLSEPGFIRRPDSSSLLRNPVTSVAVCCSRTESTPRTMSTGEMTDQGNHGPSLRVLPDFPQVYSFIGSVFDPNASGHLQKLKKMDPIDVETAILLMRNLTINLTSPDFEEHRRLLSSDEIDAKKGNSSGLKKNPHDNQSNSAGQYG